MLLLGRRGVSPAPHNHRLLQAREKERGRSREEACWGRGSEWLDDGVPVQRGEQDVGGAGPGSESQRARYGREEECFIEDGYRDQSESVQQSCLQAMVTARVWGIWRA